MGFSLGLTGDGGSAFFINLSKSVFWGPPSNSLGGFISSRAFSEYCEN